MRIDYTGKDVYFHLISGNKLLITKNLNKCYDFIIKNNGAKIKYIDRYHFKIIPVGKFLETFLKAKLKDDKTERMNRLFRMADVLIYNENNKRHLLAGLNLKKHYNEYRKHVEKSFFQITK